MAIKNGKNALTLLTSLLIFSWCNADAPQLSVINNQGIALASVGLGELFTIMVSISDSDGVRSWPRVEGLHHFHIVGQRSDMNVIMEDNQSKQERKFQYTLSADTPGTYTIGPAQLGGKESKTISITVLDSKQHAKENFTKPTFQLTVEKKQVVVGEKVPFTLRFVYDDPSIMLTNIETPQIHGLRMGTLDEGSAKSEVRNKELTHIIEYKGYLYPEKSGAFILPRLRADYTEKKQNQMTREWGFFAFGSFAQKDSVYSTPITLNIDDLPASRVPVQAVGIYKNFSAQVNEQQAPMGEAILLTLILEGDGDMEKIATPQLQLPDEFRSYESKNSIETVPSQTIRSSTAGSLMLKKWEYILQGLKEGKYTIPEQLFTYFDTKTRTIKKLKTKPLSLTVLPGSTVSAADAGQTQEEPAATNPLEKTESAGALHKKYARFEIPFPLFLLLFLIPPFAIFMHYFSLYIQSFISRIRKKWRSRRSLARASRHIKKACKENDMASLFTIMKQALHEYFLVEDTDEDMTALLLKQGWHQESVHEWNSFSQKLLNYTPFAPQAKKPTKDEINALCSDAQQWLIKWRKGAL